MRTILSMLILAGLTCSVRSQVSVGSEPLESRISQADVVCVAAISQILFSGTVSNDPRERHGYSIQVLHTYQGKIGSMAQILQSESRPFDLANGTRYLLMLNRQAGGDNFLLTDALVIPHDFPIIRAGAESSSVESDIDTALKSPPADTKSLLFLLDGFDRFSDESIAVLSDLVKSPDQSVALLSSYLLLKRNERADILFPQFLARLRRTPTTNWPDMKDAVAFFPRDVRATDEDALEELSAMTRRDVSSAAIYALRKLADPHTTSFFIQLLDSQDSDRQFTAVIALAEINHKYGDFAPGMGLFEKDRRKYIQRWKEWYRAKSQSKRDLQ
jgi:hypothetical protein